ncbi:hypothetical protein WN943_029040 [Citrus x changshan-huyou]
MQRLGLRLLHEASAGSVATVQLTGSTAVGWDAVGVQLGHRRQLLIFFFSKAKELKGFDDTKVGVKGLVDAGVVNIPRIFIQPSEELAQELITHWSNLQVLVVDLGGIRHNKLEDIVDQVWAASET